MIYNKEQQHLMYNVKDEKRESSQISLQPRRSLHKKRSGLNDNSMQSNSQLRTQVPLNKKLQEPEFKDLLFKSKKHWQKLAKIPLTQWPQLFYTTKLDLLTNSNFKFDEIINLCSQMENKYNPDFQISKVVHEIMMKLTTFTIESTGGLSLSKNKTGLAANITSVIPNNESSGSGKEKQDIKKTTLKENIQRADITNNIYDYGFCLIRVEWAAANVAVFHFGFYQVSYKTIQSFLENFNQQSQELNQQRIDKYKKLLFDEQQDQKNKYFNVNDYHFFDKNLSQLLIPDEIVCICSHKSNNDSDQSTRDYINRSSLNDDELHSSKDQQQNLNNSQNNSNTQNQSTTRRENLLENKKQQSLEELISSHSTAKKIFKNTFDQQKSISYHKNWVWRNENRNTNKDFFEVIMKQRIKEGFYFVNRGCDNGKYLFIKALPAYKVKLTKKNQQKNSDSYYENDRANEYDEIMLSEYQQMRAAMNGPEAPTVPQSAYVSILGSGFSNVKDKQSRGGIDCSNEKSSFVILNMKGQQRSNNKSNTLNYNNLQHGIENDLNHNEYYQNSYGDRSTQKLPLMEPYMSKQGDQMVASRQAFEDEYNDENDNGNQIEDRKETEQLPITKDMLMGISNDRYADKRLNDQDRDADDLGSSDEDEDISDSEKLIYIQPNQRIKNSHHYSLKKSKSNVYDSSEEMNGVEIEFNEMEKTVAQKSIRRSVVKDKLNWSCQFGQGVLSKNTKTLDGIQKLILPIYLCGYYFELVDTNGLTPLHVAIKKLQIKALEFAHKFNQMSGPPVQLTHNTCHKSQRFDFNSKGKKKLTPLHYSIAKTNFESFIFLLRQNLCDIWALDDQYRTPRSVALINSAFYKILFKMERILQIFHKSRGQYLNYYHKQYQLPSQQLS